MKQQVLCTGAGLARLALPLATTYFNHAHHLWEVIISLQSLFTYFENLHAEMAFRLLAAVTMVLLLLCNLARAGGWLFYRDEACTPNLDNYIVFAAAAHDQPCINSGGNRE
jgi:peptidoglycan/LPS O-acetylase OafA/YrhL